MKVFISWSGEASHIAATAIKNKLSIIIQSIDFFLSSHDIDAGSRWFSEIGAELENTNYGILCLTPANLNASWILFEAGALSKALNHSRVAPLLIGLKPTELTPPLSQFNAVLSTKEGIYKLLKEINKLGERSLDEQMLDDIFNRYWPDLELDISRANDELKKGTEQPVPLRNENEILEEVLSLTRNMSSKVNKLENELIFNRARQALDRFNGNGNTNIEDIEKQLQYRSSKGLNKLQIYNEDSPFT